VSIGGVAASEGVIFYTPSPPSRSCRALSPTISRWMREYEELLNIVLVSRGIPKEKLAKLKDLKFRKYYFGKTSKSPRPITV
jgi:hypothetical protein